MLTLNLLLGVREFTSVGFGNGRCGGSVPPLTAADVGRIPL